jgi:formylglycine-generating enzyme required for sulfatase activity
MNNERSKYIRVALGFGFLLLLVATSYSPVGLARGEGDDLVVARDVQQHKSVSSFLNRFIGESNEIADEPNEITDESALSRDNIWYAGTWDSLLYLKIRYPRTVAIRMKLLDQETHQPIKDVSVSIKGEYMQTLAGPGAQNQIDMRIFPDLRKAGPQRRKFGLDAISDSNGVVVFSLNWQKEYTWQDKTGDQASRSVGVGEIVRPDGIECAIRARIRHHDYKSVEVLVDFKHVADLKPGEDASNDAGRQTDSLRRGEIRPRSVKSIVLDLGKEFPDFKNKQSRRSEFFEKIRAEDYSMTYEEAKSAAQLESGSKCGPYFIYDLGEVLLERVEPQPEVREVINIAPETQVSDLVNVLVKDTNDLEAARDSQLKKSSDKPVEPNDQMKTGASSDSEELKDSSEAAQPGDQTKPIASTDTEKPKEPIETTKPSDRTSPIASANVEEPKDSPEVTKPSKPKSPVTSAIKEKPKDSVETVKPDDRTKPDVSAGTKEVKDSLQSEQPKEKIHSDPNEKIIDLGNGVTMKLALIPAGTFKMGSDPNEPVRDSDEGPVRGVRIDKPFYMGVCEVTQEQYEKVMKTNPSRYESPKYPVHMVSWYDAKEFCKALSNLVGGRFRLPTEAEWEYACRAGTTTTYYWGDNFDDRYAWSLRNSGVDLHEVGTRLPNAWGLYDMSGNLWEWCEDSYNERYPGSDGRISRRSLTDESYRVLRGGSWNVSHEFSRSANRSKNTPDTKKDYDGFRVVLEVNGN